MPIDFDANQRKAIEHRGKPLVILAGPGTGKTTTLVERIVRILESDTNSKVSFITFTRTSRRDAEKRIGTALTKTKIVEEPEFQRVATLYMFAKAFVHRHITHIGINSNFRVLAPQKEDLIVIKDVIKDLSLSADPKKLRDKIFKVKNLNISDESLNLPFQAYENLMKIYNAIDIPNLVYQSVKLFQNHEISLPNLYLHIDEYQDLNPMDQEFVDQIIQSGGHEVVVCGDDEQSIYGFRHAHPDGIRSIWENPEWESIPFGKCSRLPSHILRASRKLIEAHRGEHINKEMKIPSETGEKIIAFQCTKPNIEIRQIAKHIREIKSAKTRRDGNPISFRDTMILCPTNTIVSEFLKGLSKEGIAVKIKREVEIPENIWNLFLIIRLAENDDGIALRQWLEIVGIDENKIVDLRKSSIEFGMSFFESTRESSDRNIKNVISKIDELQLARKDVTKLLEIIRTEYGQYIINDEDFNKLEEIAEVSSSVTELIHHIYEEYGIIDKEEEIDEEEDGVLVTTLHSSKGLEAEVVYIVRANKRFLPLDGRDWDEELRSFYVGMTRTKQMLFLSFPEIYEKLTDGRNKYLKEDAMSPFIAQIREFIDFRRVTVANLEDN